MGRRLLLNLLLVAVAAGLALFIYLQPGKSPDSGPVAISALDTASISSIRLTRQQGKPIAFSRRDDRWFIETVPELPADAFQLNTLLALASAETDRQYPAQDLDLASMGLSPALATALLDDIQFAIGDTDPLDRRRYVMTGETVYLVSDRFQHLLNARYTSFVERRLLPPGAVLKSLALPQLALTRGDDDQWQLQPADAAISADAVSTLIGAWENAQALYVREYAGEPGEAIQIQLAGDTPLLEWTLFKMDADIILARPDLGIQYHLPAASAKRLLEFEPKPEG